MGDRKFDDLGDQMHRDLHDRIAAKMEQRRLRWEAKMERKRVRWQARAYRQNPFGGLFIGLLLAGIGVVLLLQNLGIFYFDELWQFWPVILIIFGGTRLVSAWDLGGRIFGGIMLLVGGIFLLHNLGLLHGNVLAYFWPVILIAIGVSLLVRALEGNHMWDLWGDHPQPSASGTPNAGTPNTGAAAPQSTYFSATKGVDSRNTFKEEHIFSGAKRRIETQEFEGGEALVIFGGIELDLRKASTKREQVFIEANAIMGGIEIRVPETWHVTVRGTAIFGGYNDETIKSIGADTRTPELIVTGAAIFGGVNLKN
jgi:predicted membrane protein